MDHSLRYCAVVPAAGSGLRFGADLPKQYLQLHGRTVLEHTLHLLLAVPRLQRIVVVVHPDDRRWRGLEILADPRVAVTAGGAERCHSVLNGLQWLRNEGEPWDWALVHDVARPCCPPADIERLLDQLQADPVGGLLAVPVSDTLKRVDAQRQVVETIDRATLWQAQTPQLFRFPLLCDALAHCLAVGALVTDEAQAVEAMGWQPRVVEGSRSNIKITRPEDLALAEYFLATN
jgi:2-C-methyl-D-erythritol 4-phosphate cytidylyltransferase